MDVTLTKQIINDSCKHHYTVEATFTIKSSPIPITTRLCVTEVKKEFFLAYSIPMNQGFVIRYNKVTRLSFFGEIWKYSKKK